MWNNLPEATRWVQRRRHGGILGRPWVISSEPIETPTQQNLYLVFDEAVNIEVPGLGVHRGNVEEVGEQHVKHPI